MKKDYFLGLSAAGFHRIAYTEWGTASHSSIPIICVHGLTRNGSDFNSLANYLAHQGAHVFCPDIVGRGDSDWLKDPLHYTHEQYALDMVTMIARIHAQQVDWIGTSMGGILGLAIASMPNSPIRRLVLNDVGAQIPTKALARLAKYMGPEPTFTSLNAAKKYFKNTYTEFDIFEEADWDRFTINSVKEIAPGQFIFKMDPAAKIIPSKSALAWRVILHPQKAWEGTLFDVDLWHFWRKITCPVLIIRGKNSDILLPSTIEKMQQIHPKTDVIEVDNAGHAPTLLHIREQELIQRWLMG